MVNIKKDKNKSKNSINVDENKKKVKEKKSVSGKKITDSKKSANNEKVEVPSKNVKLSKKAKEEVSKSEALNQEIFKDPIIKKLILTGKEKGFLTYDEVNDSIKDRNIKVESIENLYTILEELNIKLINNLLSNGLKYG